MNRGKMIIDHSYANRVKKIGIRTYVEKLINNTISKNVCEIYARMKNDSDTIFRDSAWELATERLKTQEVWL